MQWNHINYLRPKENHSLTQELQACPLPKPAAGSFCSEVKSVILLENMNYIVFATLAPPFCNPLLVFSQTYTDLLKNSVKCTKSIKQYSLKT